MCTTQATKVKTRNFAENFLFSKEGKGLWGGEGEGGKWKDERGKQEREREEIVRRREGRRKIVGWKRGRHGDTKRQMKL